TQKKRSSRPAHYADGWHGTIWCANNTRVKVPRLDLKHSTLGWKPSVHRVWQLFAAKPSENTLHVMVVATLIPAGRDTCSQFLCGSDTGENVPKPTPEPEPTTVPA
ncbi:hypothetical protein PpBr36_03686, partial [Pyricularia pennisetigena]|uniref:hypothetical protein n=1 Tax=Pyricularia pennisetigena TaxID=1578925 RepID=UPI00114E8C57